MQPAQPPRPRVSLLLLGTIKLIAWLFFPILFFYWCRGTRNVPRKGPVIIAPNHASYLDPPLVGAMISRPIYYIAWIKLFENRFFAALIRGLGAIPVDSDRGADKRAYVTALTMLREGYAVCIFPEGARAYTHELAPLKSGVARLAVTTGAPIVPVRIEGSLEAWPRWNRVPRIFKPIKVRFLKPIQPKKVEGPAARQAESERLLEELRVALQPDPSKVKAGTVVGEQGSESSIR